MQSTLFNIPVSAFLRANIADYLGENGEFTFDCFGGNADCLCYLGTGDMRILADEVYYLLLSPG